MKFFVILIGLVMVGCVGLVLSIKQHEMFFTFLSIFELALCFMVWNEKGICKILIELLEETSSNPKIVSEMKRYRSLFK